MATYINSSAGSLRITSSNGSKHQLACVSVWNGPLCLARVFTLYSEPYKRMKRYAQCDERKELIEQLQRAGVQEETIVAILA